MTADTNSGRTRRPRRSILSFQVRRQAHCLECRSSLAQQQAPRRHRAQRQGVENADAQLQQGRRCGLAMARRPWMRARAIPKKSCSKQLHSLHTTALGSFATGWMPCKAMIRVATSLQCFARCRSSVLHEHRCPFRGNRWPW